MRIEVYKYPLSGAYTERRLVPGESVRGLRLKSIVLESPEDLMKVIEATKDEEGVRWLRDLRNALTTARVVE